MMQSPWSGIQPRTFDPTPLPMMGGNGPNGPAFDMLGTPNAAPGDGVTPQWWNSLTGSSTYGSGYGSFSGQNGGMLSIMQSLIGMVQQLVAALMSGGGGFGAPYGGGQAVQDVNISSTGDPHIAETGTTYGPNGPTSVNQHYDNMSSQPDLLSTHDVAGGYRVSTTTTQPNANGVTYNACASVSANGGRDRISMNKDGSYAITDYGQSIALTKGQTLTLSGGETVTANQDGSLTVNASNARGGSVSTTLTSTGNGVDVTNHAHHVTLGGSVVNHA
jgi:hypothetical protein